MVNLWSSGSYHSCLHIIVHETAQNGTQIYQFNTRQATIASMCIVSDLKRRDKHPCGYRDVECLRSEFQSNFTHIKICKKDMYIWYRVASNYNNKIVYYMKINRRVRKLLLVLLIPIPLIVRKIIKDQPPNVALFGDHLSINTKTVLKSTALSLYSSPSLFPTLDSYRYPK